MNGVFALRYAYRTASQRGEHFYGHVPDCCGDYPIDYFTWVVIDDDRTIVIDAGFTPQTALERGSRPYLATPLELLERLGRRAEDVTDLIVTHLHYDHTGFIDAYPGARVWLQRAELDFWTSPLADRGSFAHLKHEADIAGLRALTGSERLVLLEGDAAIDERVSAHLVGGHTPGMQVVRVETDEGPIVLASDASHFYANLEGDHPYGILYDLGDMYRAFDRLTELAGERGVVVPGHDPRVRERHDAIDAEGRIVRLRAR
ncbi:N-acyl homoserine lactonase family protein [Microbacterium sp. Marseille-Q6965]|uniref:N-acyl homoserine lactonase family protein n=1 Tax=Microbacterium sp. Marseille-Q6965 TaxID=2965072 RepID=UPI0021B7C743|nr:N-acyl homoserine lactonase family protein [Microbacterium sp. Marseille-Q6965]